MAELIRPNIDRSQPTFIIGSLRSGASLLALSLGQHDNIAPLMENNWLEQFSIGLLRSYSAAAKTRATSQLDIYGVELEGFFAHFGSSVQQMMRGPSNSRQSLLIDSTPANTFLVTPLRLLFPGARFIHVVRDVREVVSVLTNPGLKSLYKSRHVLCSKSQAYDHWLRAVNAGIEAERAYGSDVVFRVQRNDLIANPQATLRACLDVLGESYDEACLRPFSSVPPESTTRESGHSLRDQPGSRETIPLTADLLSSVLTDEPRSKFLRDELAVDRLRADMWNGWTRGESLIPPIPGSSAAKQQERAQRRQVNARTVAKSSKPRGPMDRIAGLFLRKTMSTGSGTKKEAIK